MAMEFRVTSVGTVMSNAPTVNILSLTTDRIVGEFVNFPKEGPKALEVLADAEQHSTAVIGGMDVAGMRAGRFEFKTDFVAVTDHARIQFRLTDKKGKQMIKNASIPVYAHFDGQVTRWIRGPKVGMRLDEVRIYSGTPRSDKIRLEVQFEGLQHFPGADFGMVSFRMGAQEIEWGHLEQSGDYHFTVVNIPRYFERFIGADIGKGIRVKMMLSGWRHGRGSQRVIVAQSAFPFSLGDFALSDNASRVAEYSLTIPANNGRKN